MNFPDLLKSGVSLDFLISQTRLMLSSYRHWTGKSLAPEAVSAEALAREVFEAPFVLCSAGPEKDPVLNYGNARALELWEMDWGSFIATPGRHTAEAPEREERERFLKTVKEQGYIENYRGIRISRAGRRFEIKNAIVWNLINAEGRYAGQAATFREWTFL